MISDDFWTTFLALRAPPGLPLEPKWDQNPQKIDAENHVNFGTFFFTFFSLFADFDHFLEAKWDQIGNKIRSKTKVMSKIVECENT